MQSTKLKMFALPPELDYPILKAIDFIYKLVVLFPRFLLLEDRIISVNDGLQVSDFGIYCPCHNASYHVTAPSWKARADPGFGA